MQAQMRNFDDDEEEVELGDYEEGLDDDYDEEDEEYDEELDLLGDEEAEGQCLCSLHGSTFKVPHYHELITWKLLMLHQKYYRG